MSGERLEETILSLIAGALPRGRLATGPLRSEMNLRRDLGLDSLGVVALLTRCGEELGIEPEDLIDAIAVEQINTVGDVVAMGARLAGGASV
ncbi:MAG TPA: acyl carrier protein [Polyangiaceae bacterium]|jgi:acyl carrier protein|nr:acyl carrier protein [Polyangiaceae bacterium]